MESKTESLAKESNKVLELKKHVAVIHSSNKLSLLQRKIANALLYNAYKDLQEKDEHTIHISKLCEIIGYDSNDHKSIKTALINLISTVLEWNLVDGERLNTEGVWNASSIIAGASIDGAICVYSYSSQMRKLLYRPNVYGRLDMLVQSKFQSTYGLALYENCNRFQDIGQTPWFSLAQFRKLMGVEDGKYKIFRDFKTRVLDKAVEEVNKYSPLEIKLQLRKQNRQVVSIQFLITKSIEMTPLNTENQIVKQTSLSQRLKDEFGMSAKQVKQVVAAYEESYIKEKMEIILSSLSFKIGKVKNPTKYLLSALRANYKRAETNIAPTSLNADFVVNTNMDVELQTKYRRFQESKLFKLFNDDLSSQNKANVMREFEKFLVGIYQQVYLREGLENILIQEQLCLFLKKINHELIMQLPTYHEWLNNMNQALTD